MNDCTGKEIKKEINVFAVISAGGSLIQGRVVGFTPKKVKVERLSDGWVNTISPQNILIAKPFDFKD